MLILLSFYPGRETGAINVPVIPSVHPSVDRALGRVAVMRAETGWLETNLLQLRSALPRCRGHLATFGENPRLS